MLQMTVAMVHLSATRIMLNYFQTASQEIRLSGSLIPDGKFFQKRSLKF